MSSLFVDRSSSNFDWEFRYTGRREDLETGLLYFRARYCHARLGRFISRDPLGYVDGMSLYRSYFVPNGVDPSGLDTVPTGEFDDENRPIFVVNGSFCIVTVMVGGKPVSMIVDCPPGFPKPDSPNTPDIPKPPGWPSPPVEVTDWIDELNKPVGPSDILDPLGVAQDAIDALIDGLEAFPKDFCKLWYEALKSALNEAAKGNCDECTGKIFSNNDGTLYKRCYEQLQNDSTNFNLPFR